MNELNEVDRSLLESIRKRIEVRAGLSETVGLNQKDFDFLQYYVQERTGEALSLTTIKRIWKNDFQRLPHLSTLNMLSQLAFDQDWYSTKKQYVESKTPENNGNDRPGINSTADKSNLKRHSGKHRIPVAIVGLALVGLLLYYLHNQIQMDTSSIQFSAVPTASELVPNSVVFSYDVSDYRAKHFYIQQNWDPARKVEVSAVNKKQTDIYYEPGYHYAKLLGDGRVLKEIPVHIRYNDWFVRIRYPDSRLVRVPGPDLDTEGHLGLKSEYAQRLTAEMPFQLGYMLSKDFDLSADEFQLNASIRFDSIGTPTCPLVNVLIKGDRDYSWITFGNTGCESDLGVKIGDAYVSGKTNDLSAMGMNAFAWQDIRVKLTNGKYSLSINSRVVHEGEYSKKLGLLKEVDFFFNGIGSIDEIKIADNNDRSLLRQSFNQ
jgi:hypothetical protein